MTTRRSALPYIFTLCAALLGVFTAQAQAQDFPAKQQIRIISPYSPGGGNDTISRLLAERLGASLNQRVIVENKPGANTIIGNEMLAKSPPDGYTLILNGNAFTTNPSFYSKIAFDTAKDIMQVYFVGFSQLALVANNALPANSVRELIALAKSKTMKLNFGNSGYGGPDHLAAIMFNQLAGTDIAHIPYKGSGLAITDLIGGQLQVMITPLAAVQPHIQSGRMKLLAFATKSRSPSHPNVPTIAEAGLPDYEAFLWYGIMAPAGTTEPVVRRLHEEFTKIFKQKDVAEKLAASGIFPGDDAIYGTPERFNAFVREDLANVARIARRANIMPE